MPKILPESLGGPGPSETDGNRPTGSKARGEEERRSAEKKEAAGRAVSLRDRTVAYKLGKISAAAFYLTLAEVFGIKRHSMVPKVKKAALRFVTFLFIFLFVVARRMGRNKHQAGYYYTVQKQTSMSKFKYFVSETGVRS